MPRHRKNPLNIKVMAGFGVRKKVKIAFEETCERLGVNKSHVVEQLMTEFIKDFKDL